MFERVPEFLASKLRSSESNSMEKKLDISRRLFVYTWDSLETESYPFLGRLQKRIHLDPSSCIKRNEIKTILYSKGSDLLDLKFFSRVKRRLNPSLHRNS